MQRSKQRLDEVFLTDYKGNNHICPKCTALCKCEMNLDSIIGIHWGKCLVCKYEGDGFTFKPKKSIWCVGDMYSCDYCFAEFIDHDKCREHEKTDPICSKMPHLFNETAYIEVARDFRNWLLRLSIEQMEMMKKCIDDEIEVAKIEVATR